MPVHCNYIVNFSGCWSALLAIFCFHTDAKSQVDPDARQLLVAIAPDWNASRATLFAYARRDAKAPWKSAFPDGWPVLLGKNGLAWGRGEFRVPDDGRPRKAEKDGRAPAGIFAVGRLLGYAPNAPQGCTLPYHQVSPYDAWIDDPSLPHYNELVRVNPRQIPDWFERQKMRLGDEAYRWLLEIRHNADPPQPGRGSAIFFHVRRGPNRPTAGCTTLAREDLEQMLVWLRPEANPRYVLLPRPAYEALREPWHLPPASSAR